MIYLFVLNTLFIKSYSLSNIVFTNPLSSKDSNTFLYIIKIIGPIIKPINPKILNPAYIEIKVNIGWIPILLLITFGSINCLNINTIPYIISNESPRDKLPVRDENIAHGTKTVPDPSIGRASTRPNK